MASAFFAYLRGQFLWRQSFPFSSRLKPRRGAMGQPRVSPEPARGDALGSGPQVHPEPQRGVTALGFQNPTSRPCRALARFVRCVPQGAARPARLPGAVTFWPFGPSLWNSPEEHSVGASCTFTCIRARSIMLRCWRDRVEVVPLVGTAVLALGLPSTCVSDTIQSKHKPEGLLSLVDGQAGNTTQRALGPRRGANHHAWRERRLQLRQSNCGINLLMLGMRLMTHERDGPQPTRLLCLWQRFEPTNCIREWQTALGDSIQHPRFGRDNWRERNHMAKRRKRGAQAANRARIAS